MPCIAISVPFLKRNVMLLLLWTVAISSSPIHNRSSQVSGRGAVFLWTQ